jgi:hypothetical protein
MVAGRARREEVKKRAAAKRKALKKRDDKWFKKTLFINGANSFYSVDGEAVNW